MPSGMADGERLGIFGGTFDPPHVGHLVTAVNARHELGLDRVLLVVSNVPWQKVGTREISPAEARLAMVDVAVADVEGLEASRLELDAGGPSYTADTLATLLAEDPQRELFVILGEDAAAGLLTWERWEEVRDLATFQPRTGPFETTSGITSWIVVIRATPRAATGPKQSMLCRTRSRRSGRSSTGTATRCGGRRLVARTTCWHRAYCSRWTPAVAVPGSARAGRWRCSRAPTA